MRQYGPNLIRARSRFEGVSTPTNEGKRSLRSKAAFQTASVKDKYVQAWGLKIKQHSGGMNAKTGGYTFPSCTYCRGRTVQERKSCKPAAVLRADAISKTAKQIGGRLLRQNPGIFRL